MDKEKILGLSFNEAIMLLVQTEGRETCVRTAYDMLSLKYRGRRWATFSRLFELFGREPQEMWLKNGFLHCTNINKLLKSLLLASGHFAETDIKMRWTLIWYVSPHQYLQVRINDSWLSIDIWARVFGIAFGDYAHGFH